MFPHQPFDFKYNTTRSPNIANTTSKPGNSFFLLDDRVGETNGEAIAAGEGVTVGVCAGIRVGLVVDVGVGVRVSFIEIPPEDDGVFFLPTGDMTGVGGTKGVVWESVLVSGVGVKVEV